MTEPARPQFSTETIERPIARTQEAVHQAPAASEMLAANTNPLDSFLESSHNQGVNEETITREEINIDETPVQMREEAATSSLANSIQSAANQYKEPTFNYEATEAAPKATETRATNSKAQSIAEKLGFMNFDDDEFDTPSYMRKDDRPSDNA